MSAPKEVLRVSVYNGKYTVILNSVGELKALRYGQDWPARNKELTGDGLVLALAQEVQDLRDKLSKYEPQKPN